VRHSLNPANSFTSGSDSQYLLQILWVDGLVTEPWILAAVEPWTVHSIVFPRYFPGVRAIGEPGIKLEFDFDVQRHQRVAECRT
jgi:hypothetical protein